MRSVSFVDHLELEFSGNILDHGLALGDVDNDGESELVVANVAGDLAIFKGKTPKPWREFHKLGMITCVVVDDICNTHRNVLFCITTEGWCHFMSFCCENQPESNEETTNRLDDIAIYHQSLPTNSKVAIVADVDGDGKKELVIGSTDRVVRVFKWVQELPKEGLGPEDVKQKNKTLVKQNSKEGKSLIKKQNSKEGKGLTKQSSTKDSEEIKGTASLRNTSTSSQVISESSTRFHGVFVCVMRWKLSGQLQSISVVEGRNGNSPAILVSQPGGSYVYLICDEEKSKENLEKQTKQLMIQDSAYSFSDCHSSIENNRPYRPMSRAADMFSIPTSLVSWSCQPGGRHTTSSNFIAMCTLNGTLALIKDEKKYWSVDLNHNFFTVQKLDVRGSGKEEVVFCAWDGETYIMDQYQNIVNFKLGENISAFCAGMYTVEEEGPVPCLVYVTFNNRIRLYWNLGMRRLESRNFNDIVVAKLNELHLDSKYRDFVESDDGSLDNGKIKQLTSWCLYGGARVKHDQQSDSENQD